MYKSNLFKQPPKEGNIIADDNLSSVAFMEIIEKGTSAELIAAIQSCDNLSALKIEKVIKVPVINKTFQQIFLIHQVATRKNDSLDDFEKIIDCLKDKKIDINAKSSLGWNALQIAACFGGEAAMKYLMGHFELTEVTASGATLFHLIAGRTDLTPENQEAMLDYVVAQVGKKAHAMMAAFDNNMGRNAFHFAARFGSLNAVKYFRGKSQLDFTEVTALGETLFHLIARRTDLTPENQEAMLDYVVAEVGNNAPAMMDAFYKYSWNALHLAACFGSLEAVTYFKNRGQLDFTKVTAMDETLFHLIARRTDLTPEKLEAMLDYVVAQVGNNAPAMMDAFDKYGRSALHVAARFGSLKAVVYFRGKSQLDFTKVTTLGETLFHLIAERTNLTPEDQEAMLNYVVEQAPEQLAKLDNSGVHALYLAMKSGTLASVQWFKKEYLKSATYHCSNKIWLFALIIANSILSSDEMETALTELEEATVITIPRQDKSIKKVLGWAAYYGNLRALKWLLSKSGQLRCDIELFNLLCSKVIKNTELSSEKVKAMLDYLCIDFKIIDIRKKNQSATISEKRTLDEKIQAKDKDCDTFLEMAKRSKNEIVIQWARDRGLMPPQAASVNLDAQSNMEKMESVNFDLEKIVLEDYSCDMDFSYENSNIIEIIDEKKLNDVNVNTIDEMQVDNFETENNIIIIDDEEFNAEKVIAGEDEVKKNADKKRKNNNDLLNSQLSEKKRKIVFHPSEKKAFISKKYMDIPNEDNYYEIKKVSHKQLQHRFSFKKLSDYSQSAKVAGKIPCSIIVAQEKSRLEFLSYRSSTPPSRMETVTFIFCGRKDEAMLPDLNFLGEKQRIVIVATQEEYQQYYAHQLYHQSVEFLIIQNLQSDTHGNYPRTETIQARRLGAFLASYHWKLNDCFYLDDNIQSIETTTPVTQWSDIAKLMKEARESNDALISGLRTQSKKYGQTKKYAKNDSYCFKLFSLNFERISHILNLSKEDDVFILGYNAQHADYPMEDYYFQMILDFALFDAQENSSQDPKLEKHLVNLVGLEQAALKRRSNPHGNLAKKNCVSACLIESVNSDQFIPSGLKKAQKKWIENTIKHLQKCIWESRKRYREQIEKNKNKDILKIIEINNAKNTIKSDVSNKPFPQSYLLTWSNKKAKKEPKKINIDLLNAHWGNEDLSEFFNEKNMLAFLQNEKIAQYIRPHQYEALKRISTFTKDRCILKMTTASGKTLTQILLVYFIISQNPDAVVHIITATQQLVNQFYYAAQETQKKLKLDNLNVKFVQVSSEANIAITKETLKKRLDIQDKVQAFVFCSNSYFNFISSLTEEEISNYKKPTIICTDEPHLFITKGDELVNSRLPVLGFTATPSAECEKKILYNFTRLDALNAGITAPLIIDLLPYSFQRKKIILKEVPDLLKTYCHPMTGDPLMEYKGIIYTRRIKYADQLVDRINGHLAEKIAVAIHSKTMCAKADTQIFRDKRLNSRAIAVVVNQLKTGYDDPELAWCIFAEGDNDNLSNSYQKIGRGLRRLENGKIFLVLTDKKFDLTPFQPCKDLVAIKMAHPDYFKGNKDTIFSAIQRAIKKGTSFSSYEGLFSEKKLYDYKLSNHLELLLQAIVANNQEWQKGLLKFNQEISISEYEQKNMLELFLYEIDEISTKKSDKNPKWYNFANFNKLVRLIHAQDKALFDTLFQHPKAEIIYSGLKKWIKELDKDIEKRLEKLDILKVKVFIDWKLSENKISTNFNNNFFAPVVENSISNNTNSNVLANANWSSK